MIDRNEIVSLFGLGNVSFSRDEIIASCPFSENHARGDRHPSFGINSESGLYHCLACGESGNLVQLCERVLQMSHTDAIRAIYPDMTIEEVIKVMYGRKEMGEPSSDIWPVKDDITYWCNQEHEYWKQRGFTDEIIRKWRLGYDPNENRVVVPIYFRKALVGWTKRRVDENDQPKWKHSDNLPKNRILFGMDNFVDEGCILVEAPLSVIKLDQYGVHNAVASFGCNLSDEQALLLRSNYNKVLIWYDPDDAGRKGVINALGKLDRFMDVYVAPVTRDDPAALDKDEVYAALDRITPSWAWVG